jgi:hypothetical protein
MNDTENRLRDYLQLSHWASRSDSLPHWDFAMALAVVAAVAVSSWMCNGLPEQVLKDALLLGAEAS